MTPAKKGRCRAGMITLVDRALEVNQPELSLKVNSMLRFRFLAVTAVALASLAPLSANAQGPTPDAATQAALTTFRADAAELVTTLPDNKDVSSQQILASYQEGGLAGLPSEQLNTIMVVRIRAEAASWDQLDPTMKNLIRTFWDSSSTAVASAR